MNQQPVDLAHLTRQTGGDDALAREVLQMFAAHAPADLARLKAASGQDRREIAHLIVGSARAIGAGEVAHLAAAVEAGSDETEALDAAMAETVGFITAYLSA